MPPVDIMFPNPPPRLLELCCAHIAVDINVTTASTVTCVIFIQDNFIVCSDTYFLSYVI